jgi:hypothetical protein
MSGKLDKTIVASRGGDIRALRGARAGAGSAG